MASTKPIVIEKRVANTTQWGVVGRAATTREAREFARTVQGGKSTGVRIRDSRDSHDGGTVIVGS